MSRLYTGVIESDRADVIPWGPHVALRASFKKHHTYFRGFENLPHDINRLIFHALAIHVTVMLRLDASEYPFNPHTWAVVDVQCSGSDVAIRQAVHAAVERENETFNNQWSPIWCATHHSMGAHVHMLSRLQRDIAAVIA